MGQTSDRIREAALTRFASKGYEAASLAEIAADVGIKKPSIYAHFAGKEALFRSLVELSVREEVDFAEKQMLAEKDAQGALKHYLEATLPRHRESPHLRFWLRATYLPPADLLEDVTRSVFFYGAQLQRIVDELLARMDAEGRLRLDRKTLNAAYMGILRSIHADLLYQGQDDTRKTLDALWSVFELAAFMRPEHLN